MGLVRRIPYLAPTAAAALTGNDIGANYDYSIGGLLFQSAASKELPIERKTAPYRKPPTDNGTEPGEQSMAFWWIKAQSSFHGGAGQLYIDTPVVVGADLRPIRFQNSFNVDVWTPGKTRLLAGTTFAGGPALSGTTNFYKVIYNPADDADYHVYTDGTQVYWGKSSGGAFTSSGTINWGGTGTVLDLETDGRYYYVADSTGIWKGDVLAPATPGVRIYLNSSGTTACKLAWVKQRLMYGVTATAGSSIFELDNNASSGSSLPTAKYTHPSPGWVWSSFAEGPAAIYASGYAGAKSSIFKFVLDGSGVVPTLTSGITLADMPPGELIFSMRSYLGTVIGIATSAGLRVGQFGSSDFQYGPLSIPHPNADSGGTFTAGSVVGADRFLYFSYTDSAGRAGLARADIGMQLNTRAYYFVPDARFAWAPDLVADDTGSGGWHSGTTVGVANVQHGTRRSFMVAGKGVYIENGNRAASGWLTTSRLRWDTLDPKLIRFIRVRTEGAGTYSVVVSGNADSGGTDVGTVNGGQGDSGDLAVNLSSVQYATVTFNLNRDATDPTTGPTLLGYQLKALPAQKRQRFIQLPLRCFDFETDNTGERLGGDGTALVRLRALEALEEAADLVTVETLGAFPDQTESRLVVIEEVDFIQTSTPTERQGWGGIVLVTLRTVA